MKLHESTFYESSLTIQHMSSLAPKTPITIFDTFSLSHVFLVIEKAWSTHPISLSSKLLFEKKEKGYDENLVRCFNAT